MIICQQFHLAEGYGSRWEADNILTEVDDALIVCSLYIFYECKKIYFDKMKCKGTWKEGKAKKNHGKIFTSRLFQVTDNWNVRQL